ncbi:hypothetical protein OF117_16215 [Geodermatophilus sp. YIM 151500]|uniref:hypothetical protein n=1 Tax=Geodermatophilus sp. YIM 151500 TaxID=2984531 RepID=UPI0021E4189B|nr:hypothetical protein [Geodermatophilus sp. YIM 151500]MCV2490901.1 hypothetical protein [Geodermatophilus sp. YIM 151500]
MAVFWMLLGSWYGLAAVVAAVGLASERVSSPGATTRRAVPLPAGAVHGSGSPGPAAAQPAG